MESKVLAMHLDLKEDSTRSVISSEAVVKDGNRKIFVNVSWDAAAAHELYMEVNESSVSGIITSSSPDAAALLRKRRTGIMFDSMEAALGSKYGSVLRQLIILISSILKNKAVFTGQNIPSWYTPVAG